MLCVVSFDVRCRLGNGRRAEENRKSTCVSLRLPVFFAWFEFNAEGVGARKNECDYDEAKVAVDGDGVRICFPFHLSVTTIFTNSLASTIVRSVLFVF